jgi:outer membrane protein with beta-barrel domain
MRIGRLFTAGVFLMGLSAAPALAQGPTGGFEIGASLSRVSPDAAGQSITRAPSLLAGVYVLLPLFTMVGVQTELVYAQKYTHLTGTTDLRLDYVEIPILAKLRLIRSAYMLEGLAAGFPVRARVRQASGAEQDIKSDVTSPDVGLVIGGGVPIRKLAIEGRYEGGFRNFNRAAGAAPQRNRSFSLILRLRL